MLPNPHLPPDRLILADHGVAFHFTDGSCQLQCQPEHAALVIVGQVVAMRSLATHIQSATNLHICLTGGRACGGGLSAGCSSRHPG